MLAHPERPAEKNSMKLIPAEWGDNPAAIINVSFIGQNGRRVVKAHEVWASADMVTDDATFQSEFMPSVDSFASALGSTYALLSTANVDVSVTFTNPYALVNSNLGAWGSGDVTEVASMGLYLDTAKIANLTFPAPVATIFLDTEGPDMDIINPASATAGLLLALIQGVADVPDNTTVASAWGISDGERVDDSLGSGGFRTGKRITRKYTPKGIGG